MKAIITVIGKDMVGILARVSAECADYNVNITEVTQSVLQDMFAMIMMADVSGCTTSFDRFAENLSKTGRELGLDIRAMHEDIFNSMHRI